MSRLSRGSFGFHYYVVEHLVDFSVILFVIVEHLAG